MLLYFLIPLSPSAFHLMLCPSFSSFFFFFLTVSSSSHAALRIRTDVESSINVSYVITVYILEFLSIFTYFISM